MSISRAFERAGARVIDLSNIGGGVPDMIVGFAGRERLVEIKRPARRAGRGLRSTKCATCRHDRKFHLDRNSGAGEICTKCMHVAHVPRPDAPYVHAFVPDYGETKAPGGVVSNRQRRWSRLWPGTEPAVVRDEADVERVLEEMEQTSHPDGGRSG